MAWVNAGLWVVSVVTLTPAAIVCAEVVAALLPGRRPMPSTSPRPRLAILIPAHNETAMIRSTVEKLVPQLEAGDRLLVVADNCSDDTANQARAGGAEVIERQSTDHRGKGYALDFGVRHLAATLPPEVLVMVDADVSVRPGGIDALARQAAETQRPAQCVYLLTAPADSGVRDMIAQLAFTVRNRVRPLGLRRIADVCPLFGAGMAFPWSIISVAPLASGNIVEDLALALDLAADGHAPALCPAARTDGVLQALTAKDSMMQRRRWEHGHLRTLLTHAPRVFLAGLTRLRPRAVLLAMDVMVPPLSLMILSMLTITLLLALLALIPSVSIGPALLLGTGFAIFAALVATAWMKFAECERPGRLLMAIPSYVFSKIPLYLAFLSGGEKNWNRAARPTAKPAETKQL